MAESETKIVSHRFFVNDSNQIEGVELIEDSENPDGIIQITSSQSISPNSARGWGYTVRGPDEPVKVRRRPTGVIYGEATQEARDEIAEKWKDYQPLEKDA